MSGWGEEIVAFIFIFYFCHFPFPGGKLDFTIYLIMFYFVVENRNCLFFFNIQNQRSVLQCVGCRILFYLLVVGRLQILMRAIPWYEPVV